MIATALRLYLSGVVRGYPPYLICSITSRCNMKCRMYFYHERLNADGIRELSGEEWGRIGASARGVVNLSLSGGEPSMGDDFAEIAAAFSHMRSLRTVSTPTNGTLTDRICSGVREMLGRLPRRVRLEIELSLDGIEGAHDFIRGVEGCFDRMTCTAERLRRIREEAGGRLVLKTVTTAVHSNEAALEEITSFSRREIGDDRVVLSPPHGTGLVDDEMSSLDFTEYSDAIGTVYREEVRRSPGFMEALLGRPARGRGNLEGHPSRHPWHPMPGPGPDLRDRGGRRGLLMRGRAVLPGQDPGPRVLPAQGPDGRGCGTVQERDAGDAADAAGPAESWHIW